jgi:EAL domain-containing protein (putative c-di-GMP-specific phosphodiesterase class I)
MQGAPVLVGHRPVVHLATSTVVGWRLGRTRAPADRATLDDHLRAAVRQMADTLLTTDGGRRSMRFAVIEAAIDEAPLLVAHLQRTLDEFALPGRRFGFVFSGEEITSRTEHHDHLRQLVELGAGVAFDDPTLGLSTVALRAGLPITRLRLRLPLQGHVVDRWAAERLPSLVELARQRGVLTTVVHIDTPGQESLARRAGVDVGSGNLLGPVCEVPALEVRPSGDTMAAVQRLSNVVHGTRDHAWATAGS